MCESLIKEIAGYRLWIGCVFLFFLYQRHVCKGSLLLSLVNKLALGGQSVQEQGLRSQNIKSIETIVHTMTILDSLRVCKNGTCFNLACQGWLPLGHDE